MSRLFSRLTLLAALMLMAVPAFAASGPAIGKPAPDFTLTDTHGAARSLSEFKGKTVVLEWNNPECPFVLKHYETNNMQKLQEEATADGVVWLTINSSAPGMQGNMTAEEANMTIEKVGGHETAMLLDPEGTVGKLYDARTTPHMFVINAEGRLIYKGAIDDQPSPRQSTVEGATNYVKLALIAAKEGKMPETTQTNPYGCGVKYQSM